MDKNENVKNKLKTQNNVLYSSSNNKTDINNKDILNIPNENILAFSSENNSGEEVTISSIKIMKTSAPSKVTIIEPSCKLAKFLPPLNILNQNKKTLVLDLDETLIHSFFDHPPPRAPDISFDIIMDKKKIHVSSILRPGVHEFLENLENLYEIVIFTASLSQYANPLLDFIDKKGIFKYRLFREHCYCYTNGFGNSFVKDLKRLDREMKNLIIIDNNPKSFMLNKENGVPIKTWMEDSDDKELYKLIPYLIFLGNQKIEDVRPFLKDINSGNSLNYEKFDKIILEYNNKKEKDLEDELNKIDLKKINQNIFDSINTNIENNTNINNKDIYKNNENNKEIKNNKEFKNKNIKNKDISNNKPKINENIIQNEKNIENKENIIYNINKAKLEMEMENKIDKNINNNNDNNINNEEIENKILNQKNIVSKNEIKNNEKENENKNIKKESQNNKNNNKENQNNKNNNKENQNNKNNNKENQNNKNINKENTNINNNKENQNNKNNNKDLAEKKDKNINNIKTKKNDIKKGFLNTCENLNNDFINLFKRNNSMVNNKEKITRKFNYNKEKNSFIIDKKNNINLKFDDLFKEKDLLKEQYNSLEVKNNNDINLIKEEAIKNSKTITPSITKREKTIISLNKNIEKNIDDDNFFIKKSSFLHTYKNCQIKNEYDTKLKRNTQYITSNEMLNEFIKNINRNSSLDSAKQINKSLQFSEKELSIINNDIDEEEKNTNDENNNQEPLFDIVDTEKNEINLEKSKSLEKKSVDNDENEENKYEIKTDNKRVKDKLLLKRKKRKKCINLFNKEKILKNSLLKENGSNNKLLISPNKQNNNIIHNDNNKTSINNKNQKQLLSDKFPRYLSKKPLAKGIFNYSTIRKKEQAPNKNILSSHHKIFKITEKPGLFLKNKSNMNNNSIDLFIAKTKSILKNNSNLFNLQNQINGARTNKNRFYLIKKKTEEEYLSFDKNKEDNDSLKNSESKRRPTSYMKKYKGILNGNQLNKNNNNLITFSRQDKKIYLKTNNEKKFDIKKKKINLDNINNIRVNLDKNYKSQNEETKENKNDNKKNKRNIVINSNEEPLTRNFFTDVYFGKNIEGKNNSCKNGCNTKELKDNDKNKFIQYNNKAILL